MLRKCGIALVFSALTFTFSFLVSFWCFIFIAALALFVTFHNKYFKKNVKLPAFSEIATPLQFAKYQINDETIALTKPDAIFMHCLPGYRGEEMTDSVIEGKHIVVFDQGENRMHTEKAVLSLIIP